MDFDFTDEQKLLNETVTRFVAEKYDFKQREHILASHSGWSRDIWSQFAEMGLLALPFAEEDGGFDGSGVDLMIVMEALGRGLVVEPYFATVVLAGAVLRRAANAGQRTDLISEIADGSRIMALAHDEASTSRYSLDAHTIATRTDTGWRLTGQKISVIHGGSADTLIVSATSEAGLSLFLVDKNAAGLTITVQKGYDGIPIASLTLSDVHVPEFALIGAEGAGRDVLRGVFEEANAALTAEAVGVMQDAFDTTLDYLKTRHQFGVAIGSFQALQHRAVDMMMEVELSRSMAILAALSLESEPEERAIAIAQAKAQIGKSGRQIGQEAVQMHGAIGVTAEYKVGHAFKRLTAIDTLFGDRDHHLDGLANCA